MSDQEISTLMAQFSRLDDEEQEQTAGLIRSLYTDRMAKRSRLSLVANLDPRSGLALISRLG